MQKRITLLLIILMISISCGSYLSANTFPRPLRKSEVLALVTGDSLPENIVNAIQSRGIAFTPDNNYMSVLKGAGADPKILTALPIAKTTGEEQPGGAAESALFLHLSAAGKMIRAGQLDEATNELTTALTGNTGRSEAGFVMGLILLLQRRFAEAAELYSEILAQDPNFPQVHTRLSAAYITVVT
jgi:hypothetical protein